MRFYAEPSRTIVANDDIEIIRFDVRHDFDLRGVLILQCDISHGLLKHVRAGNHGLLILLTLHLRL